jgi:hypothetical protein
MEADGRRNREQVRNRARGVERRRCMLVGTVLLFVLSTPSAGVCAEEKGFSLNLWPLFQYRSDSEGVRSKLRILGPLIYRRKGIEEGECALRPLFYWTKNGRENFLRIEYLYPLGKFKREGEYTKNYIVPISTSRDEKRDGERENNFSLFVFFRGQTESGERYWGIFPLYGHLVDRFGRDRIRFYLWPLYSDWSDEGSYTWNFLWPILSKTRGGGKKAFRVWPLWGFEEEEGVSRSDFVLWPFFIKAIRDLDTDDPEREFFLLPLYRGVRSKTARQRTVLWPFFSYGVDERHGYKRWDAPWPFISFSRGESLSRVLVFPLYYHKEAPGDRTFWILWPLYQYWDDVVGGQREVVKRFLLLNRIKTVFNDKGEVISKEVSIWPFFRYSKEGDETRLSFFNLIPLRDEGLERNWAPLYTVFRYERSPSGKKWDILWGLYERGEQWE